MEFRVTSNKQQQARIATFVAQMLSIVANFAALEDVDTRLKSKFQQRLLWEKFVKDHKDRPFFRRHLRMSYDSFTILLNQIREHVDIADEQMGSLRGGKIIPELHLYATIRYLAGASY